MFSRLLIANRGEIACRIIRTAKAMGLHVIAVYSDADRHAPHVAMADEAYLIGPAAAQKSYLDQDAILAAAAASGAEAIHPGYGFLAENAAFAERLAAAGLVLVGPSAAAIRAMGSKAEAKQLMAAAGVPLVPGYHGADQDLQQLRSAADEIGYPVLLKASAGGGGKGMRVVETADALDAAVDSARREALAGFGDDRLLVEKYLLKPRHIEVQILADGHGQVRHLLERDCSLQRRHQKVVEEAPAPDFDPQTRQEMTAAAVAAAQAVDYVGAGTVEFIVDADGGFYFMEMNTRLQVEHPVTEMITGLDLVDWQIRIAQGAHIDFSQDAVTAAGHAIEVRLYAEDPGRGFLPQTGTLQKLALPTARPNVRVDAGVVTGGQVTVFYDPMIAKIIAHGADRDQARRTLAAALASTEIVGVKTNRGFLAAVLNDTDFAAGAVDTGFIERHLAALTAAEPVAETILALAAVWQYLSAQEPAGAGLDRHSPWAAGNGWRVNDMPLIWSHFMVDDAPRKVSLRPSPKGDFAVTIGDWQTQITGAYLTDRGLWAEIAGHGQEAQVALTDTVISLVVGGQRRQLTLFDPLATSSDRMIDLGQLTAPRPGRVLEVSIAAGGRVRKGDKLLILEAMKMEHAIKAPAAGVVKAIHVSAGAQVAEGTELIHFEADES